MSLSVAGVLGESARHFPDRIAVVEGATRVTYRELWTEALRCAAGLREAGVKPGDRLAVLLPNTTEFLRVYYGALAAGATVVPVHALLVADEVRYVLEHSGAVGVVSGGPLWAVADEAARAAGVRAFQGAPTAAEPLAAPEPAEPSDTAVILYTSGTTGRPKGALLTHLNIVMNASVTSQDLLGLGTGDVVLGCLPLFHSYGQTCAMNGTLRQGATLVLMPRFSGPAALRVLADEGVTVFMGVPTMYHALVEAAAVSGLRPEALRAAVSGGAALPVAVLERFEATFGTQVLEGYGLTETSPVATFNQPHIGRRPGTVGHPVWGSGWASRTRPSKGRSGCSRTAGPGRWWCAGTTSSPATSTTRRRRRRRSWTAGSARATWASGTRTASCGSWTGRRTWSSGAASTSTRARSRRSSSVIRPSRRSR